MTVKNKLRSWRLAAPILVAAWTGCAAPPRAPSESVSAAWQRRQDEPYHSATPDGHRPATEHAPPPTPSADRIKAPPPIPTDPTASTPIATVNGRHLARRRFIDLLVRSHGAALLDQLIGFEAAQAHASRRGIAINQADIDREYHRALERLADPLAAVMPDPIDRDEAERLLETVLAARNLSRVEYDIIIRRNALLRKTVQAALVVRDADVRREYDTLYGPRAHVRHIQLPSLREVEHAKARLALGDDFGDVARRYSANQASAKAQGLLTPFSKADPRLPDLFRQTAFRLEPNERSDAVRVGEWYHLIQLEAMLPARQVPFQEVRDEVRQSLSDRLAEPKQYELFEKLFREATIDIYDPVLRAAFDRRHPDRTNKDVATKTTGE